MDERCENCRFHKPTEDMVGGECHRRAPCADNQGWPWTRLADWCGEWEKRP